VVETLGDGSDTVVVNGTARHVHGYLQDFLFSPERARSPVRSLSGGERNRLLLARLFTRPANVLVLDEPTNDLDLETLELLEAQLVEWRGTLLLVSHDRKFLDNVVTQTLVAEGGGKWREFVGGYSDWLAQRPDPAPAIPRPSALADRKSPRPTQKVKLTFKEQRDLASMPSEIEALEREQHDLTARMAGADYHQQGVERIRADRARAEAIERTLESLFERWSVLEEKAKAAAAG
jgi:ATP-binding cassette subfamily F protein uup